MAEEKNIVQAKAAFNTLCQALENHDWKYSKDEENLSIECGAQGDDLPMNLTVRINSEKQIVKFVIISETLYNPIESKIILDTILRIDTPKKVPAKIKQLVTAILIFETIKHLIRQRTITNRLTNGIKHKIIQILFFIIIPRICHVVFNRL